MPETDDKTILDGIFGETTVDKTTVTDAVTQDETKDDGTKDKLYLGKYKTIEDIEKANVESEKRMHQATQEAATLRREMEELRKSVAPDLNRKQQDEWTSHMNQAIQKAVIEEDPSLLLQTIDYLIDQRTEAKFRVRDEQLAPVYEQQRFQAEINAFLVDNPEAGEYLNDITNLIQAQPEIVTKPNWLNNAYGKVLNQKLKAGGITAAQAQAQKMAAGAAGSGARGKVEPDSEDTKLKKSIFGDMNQKRRMWDY